MRTVVTTLVVPLAALIPGVVPAQAAGTFTGSGVVIGTRGEILTNSHVVESCEKITVLLSSRDSQAAVLVARDQRNDLAVVRIQQSSPLGCRIPGGCSGSGWRRGGRVGLPAFGTPRHYRQSHGGQRKCPRRDW